MSRCRSLRLTGSLCRMALIVAISLTAGCASGGAWPRVISI
jgi:hypothetical protein